MNKFNRLNKHIVWICPPSASLLHWAFQELQNLCSIWALALHKESVLDALRSYRLSRWPWPPGVNKQTLGVRQSSHRLFWCCSRIKWKNSFRIHRCRWTEQSCGVKRDRAKVVKRRIFLKGSLVLPPRGHRDRCQPGFAKRAADVSHACVISQPSQRSFEGLKMNHVKEHKAVSGKCLYSYFTKSLKMGVFQFQVRTQRTNPNHNLCSKQWSLIWLHLAPLEASWSIFNITSNIRYFILYWWTLNTYWGRNGADSRRPVRWMVNRTGKVGHTQGGQHVRAMWPRPEPLQVPHTSCTDIIWKRLSSPVLRSAHI